MQQDTGVTAELGLPALQKVKPRTIVLADGSRIVVLPNGGRAGIWADTLDDMHAVIDRYLMDKGLAYLDSLLALVDEVEGPIPSR
jgi:hypothetical protein